jgi:dynein heavy chain, axonemal
MWLGAFLNPEKFFTVVMQNYARRHRKSAVNLKIKVKVLNLLNIDLQPKEGVYLTGLYLEGARWDMKQACIVPQLPMQTLSKLPMIMLMPTDS